MNYNENILKFSEKLKIIAIFHKEPWLYNWDLV